MTVPTLRRLAIATARGDAACTVTSLVPFRCRAVWRRVTASCALLALCAPSVAQANSQVQRVQAYDLAELVRRPAGLFTEDSVPVVALPTGWVIPRDDQGGFRNFSRSPTFGPFLRVPNLRPVLSRNELDRMLRDVAGEEAWCEGSDRGLFRIQTSEAGHARIRARIDALDAVLRSRLRVRVFSLGQGVDEAVFDREAASALAGQATSRLLFEQTVYADLPRVLAACRFVSFLRDFDAMVADNARIARPNVDGLFDGVRAGIDVSPMADGRHYVRLGLQRMDLAEPMASRELGAGHLGAVDLPQVHVDEAMAAVAIDDGGGIAVGGPDGARWLVTVTRAGDGTPETPDVVATAPLGLVDLPLPKLRRAFTLPGDEPAFRLEPPTPEDPLVRLDVLLGGALSEAEQPIERIASSLLIEDQALRASVRQALRQWCAEVRTVTVQLAWGDVRAERVGGALDAPELAALADSLPHRWIVPTVPRQHFASSMGMERQFVRNYEVSITRESTASTPVMDRGFSGLGFAGIVDTRASGGLVLRLDARMSVQDEPGEFDVEIEGTGRLHAQDVAVAEFGIAEPVIAGRWNMVGTAPDPRAPERQLLLLARVR